MTEHNNALARVHVNLSLRLLSHAHTDINIGIGIGIGIRVNKMTTMQPAEIAVDLENEQEVGRLFDASMLHFENRLDLLVNNAGFGLPVAHTNPAECYETFKRIMQINLASAVRLTLLAAPTLRETARRIGSRSSVINVGSIAGFRPSQSLFAYGTSKAALSMFSDCMAIELAPLIRVNCVTPGPIETKIIERSGFSLDLFKRMSAGLVPLERVGQPDEVASSVMFLADPKRAGYITGANLVVDGGTMLAPLRWSNS